MPDEISLRYLEIMNFKQNIDRNAEKTVYHTFLKYWGEDQGLTNYLDQVWFTFFAVPAVQPDTSLGTSTMTETDFRE